METISIVFFLQSQKETFFVVFSIQNDMFCKFVVYISFEKIIKNSKTGRLVFRPIFDKAGASDLLGRRSQARL